MSVLLLNATFEPLRVLSLNRAVCLVLEDKAEVLEESEDRFRSADTDIAVPRVIRLKYFVKIPFRAKVALNRRTLMARDGGVCQFNDCERVGNTIDHVQPRAKGGLHVWENVVACCAKHNQEKGDTLMSDLGWTLKKTPVAPVGTKWFVVGIAPKLEQDWAPYLAY